MFTFATLLYRLQEVWTHHTTPDVSYGNKMYTSYLDARPVANTFIELSANDKMLVDPMKLQKLIFLAEGWYVAEHAFASLVQEDPEAWPYGPVYPSVYHEFRNFGAQPITRLYIELDRDGRIHIPKVKHPDQEEFIRRIWNSYRTYTGPELSAMTHLPDSPWDQAVKGHSKFIDKQMMRKYFQEQRLIRRNEG